MGDSNAGILLMLLCAILIALLWGLS